MNAAPNQIKALRRFLRLVDGYLEESTIKPIQAIVEKASKRCELSDKHTVVALAGTTGSGKSSLFNAISGSHISEVGVRRPTTNVPHAYIWDDEGTTPLLDWLQIPQHRRFIHKEQHHYSSITNPYDHNKDHDLRGLILIDLPDVDSVEESTREEVHRLLDLVDQIIWVLDPQKYADALLHEKYLQPCARYRNLNIITLNKIDTLDQFDAERCLSDLRHLLDNDHLNNSRLLTTSATELYGLDLLRKTLAYATEISQKSLRRIDIDLADATDKVKSFVSVEATEDRIDRTTVQLLIDSLSSISGIPTIIDAIVPAYLYQARNTISWPISRLIRKCLPDRLQQLTLPSMTQNIPTKDSVPACDVLAIGLPHLPVTTWSEAIGPEVAAAQRASTALAARDLVERTTRGLPEPWPMVAYTAARAKEEEVPEALDEAITRTMITFGRKPVWWRVIESLQWISLATSLIGLVWIGVIAITASDHRWKIELGSIVPAALLVGGGLLMGLALSHITRRLILVSARGVRRISESRLRVAVAEVASDLIVSPVRGVLRTYGEARRALHSSDQVV